MSDTPAPAPAEEEEDWRLADELHPLGIEFWCKQTLSVVAVVLGVLLAARAGFAQAARFAQRDDQRQALVTLQIVRAELEENLETLRAARDRLKAGGSAVVEVQTDCLEAAGSQPTMIRVDPLLLAEIEALFDHSFEQALAPLREGRPPKDLKLKAAERFAETVTHAEQVVLPWVKREEAQLEARARQLEEAP